MSGGGVTPAELHFRNTLNTANVGVKASASLASSYMLTLPLDDGTSGQVLTTDGSGVLSWSTVSGGGGATTALDNLASVAINTDLTFDTGSHGALIDPTQLDLKGGTSTIYVYDDEIDYEAQYHQFLGDEMWLYPSGAVGMTLKFYDDAGSETAGIKAPTSLAASYVLTLPEDDGTSGQVLTTDGAGVLSWATPSGGGGGATTALDNLASVAINSDMLPNSALAFDLGAQLLPWDHIYTGALHAVDYASNSAVTITPSTLMSGSGYSLVLPVDDGTSGQALTTDGSGNLAWGSVSSSSLTFPIVAPAGSASAPSYAFDETGDDSGMYSPGEGTLGWALDGVSAMTLTNGGDLEVVGALKAGNYSANKLAMFDSSGFVVPHPAVGLKTTTNGLDSYIEHTADGTDTSIHNFELEVNPDTGFAGEDLNFFNFYSHLDRTGSDTAFGQLTALNQNLSIEGAGTSGDLRGISSAVNVGTGTNAGSSSNVYGITSYVSVENTYTTGTVFGVSTGIEIKPGSNSDGANGISSSLNIGEDVAFSNGIDSYATITGAIDNSYNAISTNTQFESGGGASNFNGIYLGGNIKDGSNVSNIASIASGLALNEDMNSFTGVNINTQVGQDNPAVLNYINEINVSSQIYSGSTVTSYTGINVSPNFISSPTNESYLGISSTNSGTIVTEDYKGIYVDNNVNASNSAAAIYVNTSNISLSGGQVRGLVVANGGADIQGSVNSDNIVGNPFGGNSLGGTFTIVDGSPVSSTFGFGTILATNIIAEDNMAADLFLGSSSLGFSVNGFVNQLAVKNGKTVDTVNYMLAGGSYPAPFSDGGTVSNLAIFRAMGVINGGGTLNITNEIQFHADGAADAGGATNLWGFRSDATTADNWFAKNVVVGGSTKQPTNSSVGLEVAGTAKALLLSRLDETERDALTEVNGMAVYNTDIEAVQCYQNGAWTSCVPSHFQMPEQDGTVAVSSCGTSPTVTGVDGAGVISVGSGGVTSCQLDFGDTWASTPHCFVNSQNTATTITAVPSTTALIITSSASLSSGDKLDYFCVRH